MKNLRIIKGSPDWALIEALEASGELNRNDLKGVSQELLKQMDKSASDRAIDKRIEKLKEGGILHSEKIGKYAFYRLSPEADWEYTGVDLRIKKGKKDMHSGDNAIAKYLMYKDHTDDLKKVIKQWLKEFPIVSIDGVHRVYPAIIGGSELPFISCAEVKLPVESEDEFNFNDLIIHLNKQNPDIFQKWKEFKAKSVIYNAKGKDLISKIEKEIIQQFNGIIPKEAGNVKLEISSGLKVNSISENFLNFIFHACITWAERNMKDFSDHYKSFKSRIDDKPDSIEYYVVTESEGFVRIAKNLLEEEKFKDKVDNVLSKLLEKSKTDYYPEGREIIDLMGTLTELGDEIKKLLKKQLSYVVFKGDCEYLEIHHIP